MDKACDHTAVGVVVRNIDGKFALLERAKFPVGMAPIAGHIDDHGSVEQTAIDEVEEELGLIIAAEDLQPTKIKNRRVDNQCRRQGGTHHLWTVYEAEQFVGDITPSPDETKGAAWYSPHELQAFADRTKTYRSGQIAKDAWVAKPGLEEIWLDFLTELGYVK